MNLPKREEKIVEIDLKCRSHKISRNVNKFGGKGHPRVIFLGRFRFEIVAKRWHYKNSLGKLLESPKN
tara:strand:+ start:2323 stop:2526 length:204 start_codon:yes stop_codon:yes gene_type:complete